MIIELLNTAIIGPLETLFELFYIIIYRITQNPGFSVVGLSLIMNFLLLPLYKRTDAIQEGAIAAEKRMKPFVTHIKHAFKGSEQFMILETYYRQNHYKPYDALKGIAPLALEIPFFMAAYHFLSHLSLLVNASFFFIPDLALPDGLLKIGDISLHLMPILMTAINLISSSIYTEDAPLKIKLQLYGMALLFLILLYDSPSGLVLYWTCNNIFSLVKNILMKTKKPLLITSVAASLCSVLPLLYFISHAYILSPLKACFLVLAIAVCNGPLLYYFLRPRIQISSDFSPHSSQNWCSFFLAQWILTLLLGVMIPSALIHSSPLEFLTWNRDGNLHEYVLYTGLISGGTFLIWMNLVYGLSKPAVRTHLELFAWILSGLALTGYMFFGKNYGTLSSQLIFDNPLQISFAEILLNIAVLAVVAFIIAYLFHRKKELILILGIASLVSMVGISAYNVMDTKNTVSKSDISLLEVKQPEGLFSLSKKGKNVIVLMMDRAIGRLTPYIMEERPELLKQFEGFTYYPNTLSFGAHTNLGLPGVFGGYEYTPLEMNRRRDIPLVDKHNEALTVMPLLFSQEGYQTTVCDPTYADYSWNPQLSIYDAYPEIHAHITMGTYTGYSADDLPNSKAIMKRKFLYYSLFKCAPVVLHSYLYDNGRYQNINANSQSGQVCSNLLQAEGETVEFSNSYSVLKYLPGLTEITDDFENTFLMMCNDTTHSPQMLQLPNYVPQLQVDNQNYEDKIPHRNDGLGHSIYLENETQVKHYHCNMAAYIQIGCWLDFLRDQGVYDNTRIIIVGDHGYNLNLDPDLLFSDDSSDDVTFYNPLLMVKDFDSDSEFSICEKSMTNADVPTLALKDLMQDPVNPFTGNPLDRQFWHAAQPIISLSHEYSTTINNGNQFLPDKWAHITGDMMNIQNWEILDSAALPDVK